MFNDDLNTIKSVLKSIGSEINDDYDGFIVKELKVSNTLDVNRSSNQTHIAITSEQMDFFLMLGLKDILKNLTVKLIKT